MAEEDICAKEIESWSSYEYVLRKEMENISIIC